MNANTPIDTVRPASEWNLDALSSTDVEIEELSAKNGLRTLRVNGVYLHSRYDPAKEARTLIDSANLETEKPVLLLGIGLGYHLDELLHRGHECCVLEPNPAVAACALAGELSTSSLLLGIGDASKLLLDSLLIDFLAKDPQVVVHPATQRLAPDFISVVEEALNKRRSKPRRLSIAVVGPMFGGSLTVGRHLEKAFKKLGHRTTMIDTTAAWELYQSISSGPNHSSEASELEQGLATLLENWTLQRVEDFSPHLCVVLAQAPVSPDFAHKLRKHGIVSAYWFVENWRHFDYWKSIASAYDHFFHVQPGQFDEKLGALGCANHLSVQTACDPGVHCPVELNEEERDEYACSISFAGAGYRNRQSLFAGLTDYDFKLWGVNWDSKQLLRLQSRPDARFSPEEFTKIVAGSEININLHASANHTGVNPDSDTLNPRVYEIAACGGFQLCDPCHGLEAAYDVENEIPTYRDLSELRARIDHYLSRPAERKSIANAARERTLAEHTYVHRAKEMLECIYATHSESLMRRSTPAYRTVADVATMTGLDDSLSDFLADLPSETPFTYEAMENLLKTRTEALTYPEQVFAYLRHLKDVGEFQLKANG